MELEMSALTEGLAATYAGPRNFAFTVRAEGRSMSSAQPDRRSDDHAQITGTAAATAVPWSIDAEIEKAAALRGAREIIAKGAGLGAGVLVLLLMVLFAVNRQIARPLDQLAATEARLRLSEERLRSLLSGAPDYALIMLDRDGCVVSWSASAHLLEGYAAQDLLGRAYDTFFTSDDVLAGRPSQILREAAREGRTEGEGLRVRRDGSQYWAETVLTAQRSADGEVCGFVLVTHDATARREAELAIGRINSELERRVEDRTQQLRRRASELQAANAELESFSYSVSHDLRGPLRTIGGFAHMLDRSYADQMPADARHYTDRIITGAQTLSNMVDALLSLSATQRATVRPATLDMTALARDAWDEMATERADRQITFVLNSLPAGHGDPRLIRQVLANLLANAVKYTGQREHAKIEMGFLPDDSETIWYVRDNGAGFDMRQSAGLFQVFRRLHRDEEFPGTGIGLASVQRIITRHEGRIWAQGEPDQGATFFFTLGLPTESVSDSSADGPSPPAQRSGPHAVAVQP